MNTVVTDRRAWARTFGQGFRKRFEARLSRSEFPAPPRSGPRPAVRFAGLLRPIGPGAYRIGGIRTIFGRRHGEGGRLASMSRRESIARFDVGALRPKENAGSCTARGDPGPPTKLSGIFSEKQILVPKANPRLRAICATPVQKRAGLILSKRFLYCVCMDLR